LGFLRRWIHSEMRMMPVLTSRGQMIRARRVCLPRAAARWRDKRRMSASVRGVGLLLLPIKENVLLKGVAVKLTRATSSMGWMKKPRRMFWADPPKRKAKPKGYGTAGSASKVNGVEHAGAVAETASVLSPEENLVWAMLKLAAHDCLLFRRRGYIDEEGHTKLLKENLTGFEDDRLAPERVVQFWQELAQEWIDALAGKLDARRALKKMLREPYRGVLNMGGHHV
jgi:hypothetical protein